MRSTALKLDDRLPALPVDRGRTMNASEVARDVCDSRMSPKKVIERFRAEYAAWVEQQRRRA